MEQPDLLAAPLPEVCEEARRLREEGHGTLVTYSPKVFVPLTHLCRDVCHYCTFARPPRRGERAFLSLDEVLAIARAGAAAGCTEALFTLGDKPELRYRAARDELRELGCETTLEYLARAARAVLDETGLLPHLNPGVMTRADVAELRRVSASMGIMLETASERLSRRGGPHFGSPDKLPAQRLETIAAARIVLGPDASIQCPPNLSYDDFPRLLEAGIDDWGGISPVTIDHVNPEAPWPRVERLERATAAAGLELAPRLPVYPEYVADLDRWVDPAVAPRVLLRSDADGLARVERWAAGAGAPVPRVSNDPGSVTDTAVAAALAKVREQVELDEED